MDIIFYQKGSDEAPWLKGMQVRLPEARIRVWEEGDNESADYAMVWAPPYEMLANRTSLKGIFVLGAGVDALLSQAQLRPGSLPIGVPIMRLEDMGMAEQMQDYALATVLRYFRRLDHYQQQQQQGLWQPLPARTRLVGATSFVGEAGLPAFLKDTQMLINLLPNTPATVGVINKTLLAQLNPEAYILNLARGAHVVEADLLAALDSGHISGATLDVFGQEPLTPNHAFWSHSRVSMTPHIAAMTLQAPAMDAIAKNIQVLEMGGQPTGLVDRVRGY